MKTLLTLLFPVLLVGTIAKAQTPVTFTHIPGSMRQCDNRYYLSEAGKGRSEMIWIDNYDKGELLINGKEEKVKSLKFPDRLKYGFFNKNYTISIRITAQHNTGGHTYQSKGVLTVLKGNKVIYSRAVIGAGGC